MRKIKSLLRAARFAATDEATIQEALAQLFTQHGVVFKREVVLGPRMRIDFLIEGLGIEVKVSGSRFEVLRQLKRYADTERIKALLLVTTCARHTVPATLSRKPVEVVRLCTL